MSTFDIKACVTKWQSLPMQESGDVPTAEFLDACDSIISIFDCLGSGLAMVKSDMGGNVAHIRRNMAAFPPGVTLQAMVQKDIADGVTGKDGTTAMSLLWLKRALQFLERLLAHLLQGPNVEVADAGRGAYDETLTHHHNFAIRQVFKVAMRAAPYRADFMMKAAGGEAEAAQHFALVLPDLAKVTKAIDGYLIGVGLEKPTK